MERRRFIELIAGALLSAPLAAEAQQAGKVYRIGWLGTFENPRAWEAFLQGLHELGWAEGKNIVTERRFSGEKQERLRDLAAKLARLNVDVIVTATTPATLAAKNATTTIPIVMLAGDPVGAGLVGSLARLAGTSQGWAFWTRRRAENGLSCWKRSFPGPRGSAFSGTRPIRGPHWW